MHSPHQPTRTQHLFLVACLAVATACGSPMSGSDAGTGGGMGTGGGASTGGGGASTGGGGGSTGGGGGSTGGGGGSTTGGGGGSLDGNDTTATATQLTVDAAPVQSLLVPISSDVDFYRFTGTAGQVVAIFASARTAATALDPTWVDLVVTLYAADGSRVAEQDDAPKTRDPMLVTRLPTAGTYFVRVAGCHAWERAPAGKCGDAAAIAHDEYSLAVVGLAPGGTGATFEQEPNETAATATVVPWQPGAVGTYLPATLVGAFSGASDLDAFKLTVPADVDVRAGRRLVLSVAVAAGGVDGNGSTSAPGIVTLTEASTLNVVGHVDTATGGALRVPVTAGGTYVLTSARGPATGANDFHVEVATVGEGAVVERQDSTNGVAATAEVLSAASGQDRYDVTGSLTTAQGDVDFFKVDVLPGAGVTASVRCRARRDGSGLVGLSASLVKPDGTPLSTSPAVESATADAVLTGVAIPSGTTQVLLKVTASSQSTTSVSDYYECSVSFSAP